MKTAEAKPAAKQAAKTEQPFFRKGGGMFVNETANEHGSFFSSGRDSFSHVQHKPIQAKLTIGSPNDKYEQEADHVADKVVQRWSKNDAVPSHINTGTQTKTVQPKPVAPIATVSPMIQAKCAGCEQEEKLQQKEEEHEPEAKHGKLQKKPIFESNAEPPPDDKNNIQRKCAECGKEEKLQKKENNNAGNITKTGLQLKPIFESNARPEDQVQRKCTSCGEEEHVQKQGGSSSAQTAAPSVESSLNASKGSGSPLPENTRTQMESSIGADFSGVRIHNDSGASQLSNDLNAQAFTHGNDIYFNSGKYDTSSTEGKHLLAHELTHTVQQGASMYRKENQEQTNTSIQKKAPAAVPSAPVSSEVVDISKGTFSPSDNVKKEIEDKQSREGLDVRIKAGAFAEEGIIKVAKKGESYHSVKQAYLQLKNPWLQKINALALRIDIKNNIVTGLVTIKGRGSDVSGWLAEIKKAESEIGMGFHFSDKIPLQNNIINKLENGTLSLGFKDFTITIGGFFDLNLNLALENMNTPVFDGSATVTLKGAEGKVNVDNKYKGKLGGSGSLTITGFKGFSGSVEVKYDAETGATDAHGKAEYSGDKLSGSIDLIATDELTAKNFTKDAIKAAGGKDKIQDASAPAPVPAPTGDKKRALAGAGQLQFNLTTWFAGTVNVVVDAEGHITVIGKIAPPAEITLFKQKDWDKELLKFEAKAYYGIPVVGNLNLFANISLHAIAKLGPAKIYNIEILGTYSTDPEVQKNIQIAGSINISGYAGLRLRAEGGAGIEILSHDLKFGVGIQADIGVQAYADARPTIGWRDPGEFYISGTLEMVAQPMLGLGGDFFIQIETPWWSPLSDKKWTWPLFSKQWPLTDPIGINATLKDYVLGSGNVPEIEFKKPEFDASKFMTNMVDDNLPDKSGGAGGGKGEFKDDGSAKKPDVADKKPKKQPEGKPAAPGKKDAPGKPAKAKPDPKAAAEAGNIFKAAGSQLTKIKDPVSKADLRSKLNDIQKAVSGITFDIKLDNDKWVVSSTAKGINNPKPVKYKAILTDTDKKGDGKKDNIESALQEIDKEGKEKIADAEVTKTDADKIAADVKKDHPTVIQSISVIDGGATWDFDYVQKAAKKSIPKTSGLYQPPGAQKLMPGEALRIFNGKKWVHGSFEKYEKVSGTDLMFAKTKDGRLGKPVSSFNTNTGWKKYTSGVLVAHYSNLDSLKRAGGVTAIVADPLIANNGGRATPIGFISGVHVKGHLLGAQFGGSGETKNIVPLFPHVNDPDMKGVEMKVRKAVDNLEIVNYSITPSYKGADLIPDNISIHATGDGGSSISDTIPNKP